MATSELTLPRSIARGTLEPKPEISLLEYGVRQVLAFFASLRLTVVLFALSLFLIFTGTLAQKDHDVWYVVNDTYFRTWFSWIEFVTFERLIQIFFKDVKWNLGGGFYFVGGNFIGALLLLNLAAAHAVRFRIAASGRRLVLGAATILAGLIVTYFVIQSGMNDAIESELSPAFCDVLWQCFRGSLAIAAIAGAYGVIFAGSRLRSVEWWIFLGLEALLAGLTVWLLANPQARLDDAGLRILWQLVKGTAAGLVLLVGSVLVFRKRAGIVLLHGGIALMMLSELFTGIAAQESQMTIVEGATASFSDDNRSAELSIIDRSDAGEDHVTVIPASLLKANMGEDDPIEHAKLPFKVQVHRWLPNSRMRAPDASDRNAATTGFGTQVIAEEVQKATGVGERAKIVDVPSAYVELFSSESGSSLGTYVTSPHLDDQVVEVDGKKYDLALRFKRIHYPYTLTLKDFRFDRYTGTNTAKNYSALVQLKDPRHNIDREMLIRMNNPLRYDGITFYQSDFDPETEKMTVLSVVDNPSWMTPYVACMLVATGMLAHFGVMLVRFLRRRAEEARIKESASGLQHTRNGRAVNVKARLAPAGSGWATFAKWFPAVVTLFFAGYVVSKARMPESKPTEMQIYEFGKLPLAYQGRVKPYDTLAHNTLQILSGRQELVVVGKDKTKTYKPAIGWLLDVISGVRRAEDHQVFRIENLDLVDTLGLEHRPLHWRYSLSEIDKKRGELNRQIDLAAKVPDAERSLFQNNVIELAVKRNLYMAVSLSFQSPPISLERDKIQQSIADTQSLIGKLREAHAPHAVPPKDATTNWLPLLEAEYEVLRDRISNQTPNRATLALSSMLSAYARDNASEFNNYLAEYRLVLADYERSLNNNAKALQESGAARAEILSQSKVDFEVFYNQFSPFYYAAVLYFFAFVLGVLSWIGWSEPLRRGSMWLLGLTLVLHTFALIARIYISGRPPITNLYSTAIFIGWGGVILALLFESIYRLGLGNIVASIIGFLTLLVAHFLSLDGDTFIVLQAVLDTQFWLATHVVTINTGYAATYTAGLWGAIYILLAHVFPVLNEESRRQLTRMLYGTLCFAIFFSFVGTVLGGLWGDDSWGRFWGWDPKENGALMIVLWNALVLHARWGGMVKGRGLATLAVGGNIVTTWSYFGVNELGEGLHAYGASESSTAMWLLVFGASQLALIGLGMMPRRWFESLGLARSGAAAS
jgi:ABC-type transport system involved in cytochrome c biogenesis permease subunit